MSYNFKLLQLWPGQWNTQFLILISYHRFGLKIALELGNFPTQRNCK